MNTTEDDETDPLLLSALEAKMRFLCPDTLTESVVCPTPLLQSVSEELPVSALRAQADCVTSGADFAIYLTPLGVGHTESESLDDAAPLALTTSIATSSGVVDVYIQTFSFGDVPKKLQSMLDHHVWAVKKQCIPTAPPPEAIEFAKKVTLAIQEAYVLALQMVFAPDPSASGGRKKLHS
ncbi:MAG: hypothetical protein ACYCZ0_03075 [Minisyncoccota bacterium]